MKYTTDIGLPRRALRQADEQTGGELMSSRVSLPLLACVAAAAVLVHTGRLPAGKFNRKINVGDAAPAWSGLAGVDGKKHSLEDYKAAKILVIAFTCNHCPVAQLYEERFIRLVKEHKSRDLAFVAISCSLLPGDSLEKMKERAREKGFNFDYLIDPAQATGKEYGATVTPQLFVLDQNRTIAYMGKFDDSIEADKVQREFVREAVRALQAGKKPEPAETFASGCGIEYARP
jgi:peroxiredoxin